jgi:soluble lytic murein transglycosylase
VRAARQRARRRRVLRLYLPIAAAVVVVVVVVVVLTGKLVIPALSGKVYPIKYEDQIAAVAKKYDVDPYLLAAVARTESGFDPQAQSHAGAVGLMQLLPTTAEWVTSLDSWKGPEDPALTDPKDSLELGACYLAYLQRTLDDPVAAIAAYNAGQGMVRQWIADAGGPTKFDATDIKYSETREFVRRVEEARKLFLKAHPDAFSAAGQPA